MTTHEVPTVRLRALVISQIVIFMIFAVAAWGITTANQRQDKRDQSISRQVCDRQVRVNAYIIVSAGWRVFKPVELQRGTYEAFPLIDCRGEPGDFLTTAQTDIVLTKMAIDLGIGNEWRAPPSRAKK